MFACPGAGKGYANGLALAAYPRRNGGEEWMDRR